MNQTSGKPFQGNSAAGLLLWEGRTEIGCGGDYHLAESKKDVRRILWDRFTVTALTAEAGEDAVSVRGEVTASVIYQTESGGLSYAEFVLPVEGKTDAPGVRADDVILFSGNVSEHSSEVLNPGKLRLSGRLRLYLFAFGEADMEPVLKGLEQKDRDSVRFLTRESESNEIKNGKTFAVPVSLDLTPPSGQPPIGTVVCTYLNVTPITAEAGDGTLTVTSDCSAGCIYESANGNHFSVTRKMTLSETVEAEQCAAGDGVFVTVTNEPTKYALREDGAGENKTVELDGVYHVNAVSFRKRNTVSAADLYSVLLPSKPEELTVDAVSDVCVLSTGYSHNVSASKEDCGAEKALSVIAAHAEPDGAEFTADADRNKIAVTGTVRLTALTAETDENGEPAYGRAVLTVPFRCELDTGRLPDSAKSGIADVSVQNVRARVDSAKIYFDTEMTVRVTLISHREMTYVNECGFSREPFAEDRFPGVILYYPNEKDTAWSIAKRYHTDADAILSLNQTTEKELTEKRVLLIPCDKN